MGGGAIWAAMTAMGKTFIAKRVLELICPLQVIDFGKSNIYGWKSLKQVCYVYVDFATNGTRIGLLKRILLALDYALGTSLSDDFKRVTNTDVLLIEVCRQLSNVRCIMLVIDEKQERNFEDSPWKLEFVFFYMSLMNLGINVVLLGNPLAFVHLKMFSQVMRRFSKGGHYEFLPAPSAEEAWWRKDFAPRIRKFDLMDRWDVPLEERRLLEFEKTAGIPGLLSALHCCTQIEAIRRSGNASEVTVTAADFKAAEKSATFVELRRIALAVSGEGRLEETAYLDVPSGSAAAATPGGHSETQPSLPSITKAGISHVQQMLGRHMARQSAQSRKFIERLKSMEGLSDEELRLLGIEDGLLDELHKRSAESTKKPAPGMRPK